MSQLTTAYRHWTPHKHRNHHAGRVGEEVPGIAPMVTVATWQEAQAPQPPNEQFLFWSVTGNTVGQRYSASTSASAAFPPGTAPATMTAWYEPLRVGPVGGPGVRVDAFSLATGDFLDWGNGWDPFTVDPARKRDDDKVDTSAGSASVTAEGAWGGPGHPLRFETWLTFRFAPAAEVAAQELLLCSDQSGVAFALYAPPVGRASEPIEGWTS
jgi:hypothetical protein